MESAELQRDLIHRTVTAAQAGPAMSDLAYCETCNRREPKNLLWGIDRQGITTSDLKSVYYWLCRDCFCH